MDIEVELMNRGQLIELIIICSIIITILSLSGCIENGNDNDNNDQDLEEDWREWPIIKSDAGYEQSHSDENSEEIIIVNITEEYVTSLTVELTWEDEPPVSQYYENQPDTFKLRVSTSWEEDIKSNMTNNSIGEAGYINLTINVSEDDIVTSAMVGEWAINIQCVDCGDQERSIGPIGFTTMQDDSNAWELTYYYEFHRSN